MSLNAEGLFRALLNECDDYGRLEARPAILRATVWPLRVDQIAVAEIEAWLDELAHSDDPGRHPGATGPSCIALYEVGGVPYLCFPKWEHHRGRSKRGSRSRFPAPPSQPEDSAGARGARGYTRGPVRGVEESRSRGVEEKKSSLSARALPEEAFGAVKLLSESIAISTPGAKVATTEREIQDWAEELDRLHRIGAPGTDHPWAWKDIEAVIHWLPTHRGSNGFAWGPQIRSAAKLRIQFPRLHVEMMNVAGGSIEARKGRAQGALQIILDREQSRDQATRAAR